MISTDSLKNLVKWFGPLRLLLYLGALAMIALRPAPGLAPVLSGWDMVPTLITPALVPLFFMGLLLDAIMSGVQRASHPEARRRYLVLIGIDLGMALWLVAWWWGFFRAIIPGATG